jgi:hypothetical protein
LKVSKTHSARHDPLVAVRGRDARNAIHVTGISLAIASGILFVFFNGRVFSTEYHLTPTSEARLN